MDQSPENNQQEDDDDTNRSSSETPTFEIGDFLEKNYPLFTVLSIFGAISIYIFGLRDGVNADTPVIIGFVSSQFLLLLSAYAIYKRILDQMNGFTELLDYILHPPSKSSIELLIFLTSFTALVASFLSVSAEFTGAVSLLLQALAFPFGYAISVGILEYTHENTEYQIEFDEESTVYERTKVVVTWAIEASVIIVVSIHFFNQVDSAVIFDIPKANFFNPVISALLVGSGLFGGIYAFAAVFSFLNLITNLVKSTLSDLHDRLR